jgi:hypothetical protein
MKPLFLCYSAIAVAQCLTRVWGQIPPFAQHGHLAASAQIRSLRQFYWIRELPPQNEKPGIGRLGYFGSELPVTLIWRAGSGSNSGVYSLLPNTWLSESLGCTAGSMTQRGHTTTIQIEIE